MSNLHFCIFQHDGKKLSKNHQTFLMYLILVFHFHTYLIYGKTKTKPCFKSVKKSRKPKGYILDNQISFLFIRRILFLLPPFSRYASKQSQWAILIAEYIFQILSAQTSSTESKSLQLIIPSCKLDDRYEKKAILF